MAEYIIFFGADGYLFREGENALSHWIAAYAGITAPQAFSTGTLSHPLL